MAEGGQRVQSLEDMSHKKIDVTSQFISTLWFHETVKTQSKGYSLNGKEKEMYSQILLLFLILCSLVCRRSNFQLDSSNPETLYTNKGEEPTQKYIFLSHLF